MAVAHQFTGKEDSLINRGPGRLSLSTSPTSATPLEFPFHSITSQVLERQLAVPWCCEGKVPKYLQREVPHLLRVFQQMEFQNFLKFFLCELMRNGRLCTRW